jgi:hypothetical protein
LSASHARCAAAAPISWPPWSTRRSRRRDEFLAYGFGDNAAALSKQALLFKEFLALEAKAGKFQLKLKPLPQKTALLHGHCYQKAFDAVRPVQTVVLGLIPRLDVS